VSNPYQILGVSKDATFGQVRKAYLLESKKCHPDLNGATAENMNRLNEVITAFNEIKNDLKLKYAIFGLSNEADFEEVKLEYHKMLDELRSKFKNNSDLLNSEVTRINNAFKFIKSSLKHVVEEEW